MFAFQPHINTLQTLSPYPPPYNLPLLNHCGGCIGPFYPSDTNCVGALAFTRVMGALVPMIFTAESARQPRSLLQRGMESDKISVFDDDNLYPSGLHLNHYKNAQLSSSYTV
jgi:hypothetical protein